MQMIAYAIKASVKLVELAINFFYSKFYAHIMRQKVWVCMRYVTRRDNIYT